MATPTEILDQLYRHGVQFRAEGNRLIAKSKSPLTDDTRELIRQNKPAILYELSRTSAHDATARGGDAQDRQMPASHRRVWAMLMTNPAKQYVFDVLDPDSDPVRVTVAVRGIGTCDLLIARSRWDPGKFMQLISAPATVRN
ncbi:MAG: hypothetical protein HY343_08940 [Lentisphaerae bacterium]|nr:hypothetical protein [Lentisphaerota bacterium]